MRDVFATLFFTSISLSIEPLFLWEHLRQLLGLVAISLIGKAAIATIVVSFFGYSLKTSLTVGTAALTLLIAPFILRAIPSWLAWLERWPSVDAILQSNRPSHLVDFGEELTGHIVVVGYGRVGQTLVRMIYFQGYRILAIDNNEAALQTLRERNIPYLFGDGSSQLVLEKANLARAKAMAITLPDPMATRLALNRALSIAPDLDITVRAHVDSEIDTLY
jgi:CPA2 family monovalent cation:H+ antiporter-2